MRALLITIACAGAVLALAPRDPHRSAVTAEPPRGRSATPPPSTDPCAPLRFVVTGDGRAAVPGVGPSAYKEAVMAEALRTSPAFVVDTGDIVFDGEVRAEWDRFLALRPAHPPYLAVRGNHDVGLFYDLGLASGPVVAHRYGPVLLVGFDTEGRHDADVRARIADLDRALSLDDAPWKIVAMHRPVWSSGPHGGDERALNRRLVPVLEKHRVAVVFSGHDHEYERFCASVGVGPERRCDRDGVVYVVTGGGGTFTNHWPLRDDPATRAFSGSRHFVEITVDGGALSLTTHRTLAGNLRPPGVIDRHTIRRESTCGR